jgi:hypothetical protein
LKARFACALLVLVNPLAGPALARPDYAPDTPEPGSVEAIAAATTDPRFSNPWVAYVPESSSVPSPSDYLGHIAGAPGHLSRTAQVFGYLRALDAASPRVKVETIGRTEEGRDIILAIVADEEAMGRLEALRESTALLADSRRCDDACLERTLSRARPIYHLNGGLHSTEFGSPEMLMELAYRLAVSERPEIRLVRERLVVTLNPVAEPDGRDRAVDWYYRYLKGKTDYDSLPEGSPPFWGKYVFHDNNRDGHQRALALTRASQDYFLRWHPQVVHDLHESAPFLLSWTGTGPYSPHLDPTLVGEWHQMAFHEVRTLSALGMPGVWTWGAFSDGWGHFYADSVAINHNAVGRGYETFGTGSADTMDVRLDLRDEEYSMLAATRRDWYRPWPPPRSFRWSMRNNTNYMQTGVLAVLEYSARHADEMLRDFHVKGKRAVERGAVEPPYAYVIPEAQSDRARLAQLVNLVREHGIEVHRARAAFRLGQGKNEREYPAGTFVVRLDQPYRSYAMDLLDRQRYPAHTAPYVSYDDVSWSLSAHFGVEVARAEEARVREVPLEPVTTLVKYAGKVEGDGPVFLLRDAGQESLHTARHRLAKFRVEAAERPFSHGGAEYPAGSWILPAQRGLREALDSLAAELGLDFASAPEAPSVSRHPLDLPRLAVFSSWNDTQAAGWVRMIFDQARVPYAYVLDDEVKRGGLNERFDVILVPHTYQSFASVVQGIDPKDGPMPYTATKDFPTHGAPASSPDITGGLGYRGLANLKEFVERGGVLVTLGGASAVPLEGGFTRHIRRARAKNLHTPGIEIAARFARPTHPLAYGYDERTSVFREDFPLYETREADVGLVVLRWGIDPPKFYDPKTPEDGYWAEDAARVEAAERALEEQDKQEQNGAAGKREQRDGDKLVISGGMKGEGEISGRPALLDVPLGKGRLVIFNFDPIHRFLNRSDHRLVWNAVLNWNDLPLPPPNPAGSKPAGAVPAAR